MIFIVLLLFIGVVAFAQTTQVYLTGYSWSANTGWVRGNNCTDPANQTGCNGTTSYTVTTDDDGALHGYAWSNNLGWISFESDALSGCPSGTFSASVDWANPNKDGTYSLKGWARVCSVFQGGCSGDMRDVYSRGSNGNTSDPWDGFISLSGVATDTGKSPYGAVISSDKTKMTGYAWGGQVVGWVQMNFNVKEKNPECSDSIDNEDPEDTLADKADPGCHTDGDVTNDASYDPEKNNELNGPEATSTTKTIGSFQIHTTYFNV